jgi:hypothetical protein
MKSLHFCTKGKLIELHESQPGNVIITHRTGFITHLLPGDIVKLNERKDGKDEVIRFGEVAFIGPIKYGKIEDKSEINRAYEGKEFNDHHYFFQIGILIKQPEEVTNI